MLLFCSETLLLGNYENITFYSEIIRFNFIVNKLTNLMYFILFSLPILTAVVNL